MALRAGYYGIKKKNIIPKKAMGNNPLVTKTDILNAYKVLTSENAVNLLPITFSKIKSSNTSGEWADNKYTVNGLTFTVNDDNTITVEGTAIADTSFTVIPRTAGNYVIEAGLHELTGCPVGGDTLTYMLRGNETIGGVAVQHPDKGSGVEIDVASANIFGVFIYVHKDAVMGTEADAKVFKPMLWKIAASTDIFPDYAPYVMSNKTLSYMVNAIITAATGAADFAAFKTAVGAITPVTRSLSTAAAPEEIVKDEIEEPVVEKKTTIRKKSTAKADTTEEV